MKPLRFLSVENVLLIHTDTLREEGGGHGVRDLGLLESAVAMPQAQFGGVLLHPDLAAMAGAYLFHLASNHPFIDGNKRVAVLSALVFLTLNGVSEEALPDEQALEEVTFAVARHEMSKETLISWFRASLSSDSV